MPVSFGSTRCLSRRVSHLGDGGHEVARGRGWLVGVEHGVGDCADSGHPLHVLVGEVGLALLLALGQSHIQRLGGHDAPVHLSDGLGGLLRGGEAHKAKALAAATFHHHLGGETVSVSSACCQS